MTKPLTCNGLHVDEGDYAERIAVHLDGKRLIFLDYRGDVDNLCQACHPVAELTDRIRRARPNYRWGCAE